MKENAFDRVVDNHFCLFFLQPETFKNSAKSYSCPILDTIQHQTRQKKRLARLGQLGRDSELSRST